MQRFCWRATDYEALNTNSSKYKLVELMPTSLPRWKRTLRSSHHPAFVRWLKNKTAIILNVSSLSEWKRETKPSSPLIKLKLPWVCQRRPISRLNLDQKAQTEIDTPPPTLTRAARDCCARRSCTFRPHHLLSSRVGLLQKSIRLPWCVNFCMVNTWA